MIVKVLVSDLINQDGSWYGRVYRTAEFTQAYSEAVAALGFDPHPEISDVWDQAHWMHVDDARMQAEGASVEREVILLNVVWRWEDQREEFTAWVAESLLPEFANGDDDTRRVIISKG